MVADSIYPCGFCVASPGNERHDLCPSAVESNGRALRCPCGCQRSRQIRCFTCDRREDEHLGQEVDHATWRCFDLDSCAAALEARLATNPTIALIRSIAREKNERSEKPTLPRTSPAARKSGACLHCGEATKGGLFLPGHDAAWLSQMVKELIASHPADPELRMRMGEDRIDFMREKGCSDALIAKFRKRVATA
ncbi:hypothetical protein [Curtobacterium phage Parvaparticeps]|nr:hypothetical protein [Curtobacterium phage Parvaparticeps]